MSFFNFSEQTNAISEKALAKCKDKFDEIDRVTEFNQQRVLKAFIDNGVSESHFSGSTGYGYGDRGREVLDEVTAQIFGAEDALIRHSFASGTHTLSVMLFGVLRPGDTVLCATGVPYDTIHSVIGLSGEGMGSLKDFGIGFEIVDLKEDGTVDYDEIKNRLSEKEYKAVYNPGDDRQAWFDKIKEIAPKIGFAAETKEYKANPDAFKGHAGDLSTVLRIAITGRRNTPDLCSIMQVLGKDECIARIDNAILNI